MTTFAEATLALGEVLSDSLFRGVADTGSSTTKVVDADLHRRPGFFSPGVVWILTGSASPEFTDVLRHQQNTLQFAALAAAVSSSDEYAVMRGKRFSKQDLEKAINLALLSLDEFTQYNETLTTVSNQEEYTLPSGVENVVGVWIRRSEDPPYLWSRHQLWRETNGGKLRFEGYVPSLADRTMRIAYNSPHARLVNADDTINPGIRLARLKYEAAVIAWSSYLEALDSTKADSVAPQKLNEANAMAARAPAHRVRREERTVMLSGM